MLIKGNDKDKTAILHIALLAISLLSLFNQWSSSSSLKKLAQEQIIGVQLTDGEVIKATTKDPLHRENSVIIDFIKKWYYLTLDWSSNDLSVEIAPQINVPGNVYASSLALSSQDNFSQNFSREFQRLINSKFQEKKIDSNVKLRHISDPKPLKPGQWEIYVVADWIVFDSLGKSKILDSPFNKRIIVEANTIPPQTYFNESQPESFQKIINKIKIYGLTITEIGDIKNE